MKIDKKDKINYITNYFHQYYDIKLNKNFVTTSFVNLVMPIEQLSSIGDKNTNHTYSHNKVLSEEDNIKDILNKYKNISYDKSELLNVFCLRVLDGDTMDIVIPYESPYDETEIETNIERVRLVGINTPEENIDGFISSKQFLEKIVYDNSFYEKVLDTENYEWEVVDNKKTGRLHAKNPAEGEPEYIKNQKKIQIKVDSKKQKDKYGRVLAVVIVNNKNINEVMLKEGFAEIMYIPPSEFNPFDWRDINTPVNVYTFQNDTINLLSQYFNSNYSNIIFTPQSDLTTIYPCEIYKNVIYVKLFPFSQDIRMHILPKVYDCSDDILFLRDEDLDKRTIPENPNSNYKIYEDRSNINAYYQIDGVDRKREQCSENYNPENWENEWVEFNYDISKDSPAFDNIQICAGYSYNHTSPYHALHYLGIKDESNRPIEDRAFLVDVNTDTVLSKRNIITQMIPSENDSPTNPDDDFISTPPHNDIKIYNAYKNDINHISIINQTHHKTIKYIHDALYSEEDMSVETENKKQYTSAEWIDIIKDGYKSYYNEE